MTDGTLHIGIGNALRRDDGVGPWVALRLAQAGLRARGWPGDGAGLIDLFGVENRVVLIDATRIGGRAGALLRFDALQAQLPRPLFHNSTHEFGLAEAVEVARRLGQLPDQLNVYGIEGQDFDPGEGLTTAVLQTARGLAQELLERAEQRESSGHRT